MILLLRMPRSGKARVRRYLRLLPTPSSTRVSYWHRFQVNNWTRVWFLVGYTHACRPEDPTGGTSSRFEIVCASVRTGDGGTLLRRAFPSCRSHKPAQQRLLHVVGLCFGINSLKTSTGRYWLRCADFWLSRTTRAVRAPFMALGTGLAADAWISGDAASSASNVGNAERKLGGKAEAMPHVIARRRPRL
jgi:hypothetical protein